MIVTQDALVSIEVLVGKLSRDKTPLSILRISTFNFWKYAAQRSRQSRQSPILFRGKIILHKLLALNIAAHQFRFRRMSGKMLCANTTIAELLRHGDSHSTILPFSIP